MKKATPTIKRVADASTSKPKKRNETNQDSNTDVYFRLGGKRSPHSVRCNDKLFRAWISEIKARGDSVCHHQEAFMTADLIAMNPEVYLRNTLRKSSDGERSFRAHGVNVTIENLHVQRVVQRHRRVTHEYMPEPNFYDGCWKYISDAVLNGNGHAVGCGCKVCSGRRDSANAKEHK